MSELSTTRLLLRHWRPEDREPWAALNADPQVMEYFPARLARAQSDELIERWQAELLARGWGWWAVQSRAAGDFLGAVALTVPRQPLPCSPCVEVGWRFARAHWGRGYASEAAAAVLEFGFEVLELNQVVALTALGNRRSRAVMERLGMVDAQADFDHPALPAEHPLARHCLYRIDRAQWQAGRHPACLKFQGA